MLSYTKWTMSTSYQVVSKIGLRRICRHNFWHNRNRAKNEDLIQNSQAVKKVCGPQKGYGEKRCEIQGGGQEMAVMVG